MTLRRSDRSNAESRLFENESAWSPAEPVVDLPTLGELRDFGERFLLEMIEQFTNETDLLLTELREAFSRNDSVAVGRIVHSIKGTGSLLGGRRLVRACNRLERRANYGFLPEGESDLEAVKREYDELTVGLTFAATLS